MRRCVIVGGAEIRTYDRVRQYFQPDDFFIYCDCGLRHQKALGAEPDLIVGDFDSHEKPETDRETIVLPVEKDDTDMMLAVKRGLERGETLFHLYGGMGGQRTDHTVANLQALLYLADHGAEGWLHGRGERWTAIRDGSIVFPARPEGILSVFCVGPDAEGVTIRGAQYPLEGATLTASVPLGVSNHFIGQDIMVEVTHGSLLLGLHD